VRASRIAWWRQTLPDRSAARIEPDAPALAAIGLSAVAWRSARLSDIRRRGRTRPSTSIGQARAAPWPSSSPYLARAAAADRSRAVIRRTDVAAAIALQNAAAARDRTAGRPRVVAIRAAQTRLAVRTKRGDGDGAPTSASGLALAVGAAAPVILRCRARPCRRPCGLPGAGGQTRKNQRKAATHGGSYWSIPRAAAKCGVFHSLRCANPCRPLVARSPSSPLR
jgi:hypothetical protein